MSAKLKDKRSLFDPEAFASHISIASSKTGDLKNSKSGLNSSKQSKSKMKSSQSGMKESKNSESASSVSGSMSKT